MTSDPHSHTQITLSQGPHLKASPVCDQVCDDWGHGRGRNLRLVAQVLGGPTGFQWKARTQGTREAELGGRPERRTPGKLRSLNCRKHRKLGKLKSLELQKHGKLRKLGLWGWSKR